VGGTTLKRAAVSFSVQRGIERAKASAGGRGQDAGNSSPSGLALDAIRKTLGKLDSGTPVALAGSQYARGTPEVLASIEAIPSANTNAKMRVALTLVGLFVSSICSIVISAYDFSANLSWLITFTTLILRESQTLKAALFVTFLCPLGAFYCFWSCKGKERHYRNELMAVSCVTSWLVVIAFLPGSRTPDWMNVKLTVAGTLLWASSAFASTLIRDWVWIRGGRESET
jgi:hypothetical protein